MLSQRSPFTCQETTDSPLRNKLPKGTYMRDHTLFSTYLNDLVSERRTTAEHLAGELDHRDSRTVQSWLDGWAAPEITELGALARLLHADPVVMTAGWLIDSDPSTEGRLRRLVIDPLGGAFPRSNDLTLRLPRPRPDMNVGDPHDSAADTLPRPSPGRVKKRSAAARD